MFKKILLPTDGSELSVKAVQGAIKMASELGASVVGLTVVEPYSYSTLSEYRPETLEAFEARNAQAAEQRLAPLLQAAKAANVPCETMAVKSFSPYEAIIDAAKKTGCDVIFMASHGRRGLRALVYGSQAQGVLTHSKIPTLVYR